jgi:hypothetical protein
MKRKAGLHKRVSSIFGDVPRPDNPSAPPVDNAAKDVDSTKTSSVDSSFSDTHSDSVSEYRKQLHQTSVLESSGVQTAAKIDSKLTEEEQEYAASQRKKLYLVIGLCGVLALVFYFNFYKPGSKKTDAGGATSSKLAIVATESEINWPQPQLWPDDIRDPMVFREDEARLYAVESNIEGPFVLRGIIYQLQGRSQALIGIEILYEGDEIQGWIVKEISADSVKLQKQDGEELELRMEDR